MAEGRDSGIGRSGSGIGRRGLLAGAGAALLAGAVPGWASSGQVVRPEPRPVLPGTGDLQQILAGLPRGARGGAVVIDAASGRVLEAQDETVALPPGSVQKTITSLFALDRLGAGRQLATRVVGSAPVRGGALDGDLWLVGGGDPSLDTDSLGDMVALLRATGLKRITGRFFYDASVLPAIARIAYDQPEDAGYNPGVAGLLLNYDRVYFKWTKGAGSLEMMAEGERYRAPVQVATMTAVNRDAPVFEREDRGGVEAWTVAKGALVRDGSRWLPVRHVAPYVADVFRGLCAGQGIALPAAQAGAAPATGGVELAARQSDALAGILRLMLKYSTNVTAETLGLLSSGADSLPASGGAMERWAAANLGLSARFVDHSGLGAASRVAPLGLAKALRAGAATASGAALRELLRQEPLLDAKGRRIAQSGVVVHAKTGTLNYVSALAGFIEPPNGRRMIFAIETADLPRRARLTPAEADRPPGLRSWLRMAHVVQGDLVRRWAQLYGGAA